MNFNTVANYFSRIEATSSRLEMTQLLAELLTAATPQEADMLCNIALGQLKPPYLGTQFNIAEKTMIKVIARLCNESEKHIKEQAKKLGDLGLVIENYETSSKQSPTLEQVFSALAVIEAIHGTGSQEDKIKKLEQLLTVLDPMSAKYVVRIVLGKLRLGFSDMTIVDALSWMETNDKSLRPIIENAYNICANIGLIAMTLKQNGIEAIKNMDIHMGIPILPAAAERLPSAQAIVEKLGPCVAQPKLDGFRLQIHVDKTGPTPEIHFFSRNLQDMSYMFPDIKQVFEKLPVDQLICEGEAIVYDPYTHSFLPFQETVKRKRKHNIEEVMAELPLRVYIFDLLYLNGKEYLNSSHHDRRNTLLSIFKKFPHDTVQVIEEKTINNAKDLEEYFTATIASGLEGLVVKKPNSLYQPGKRNFNWIKLKRHEEGHLDDTLDCVVLGYYTGKGKRAHFGIGAFLVGLYNKKEDRFETVAKIGTGLKDEDWTELKKKCLLLKSNEQPKNVVCAKELTPDVWTSPELVVVVRADEITMSPLHSAGKTQSTLGFALRFPRFMGYRLDKSAQEATTITELAQLYKDQFI